MIARLWRFVRVAEGTQKSSAVAAKKKKKKKADGGDSTPDDIENPDDGAPELDQPEATDDAPAE